MCMVVEHEGVVTVHLIQLLISAVFYIFSSKIILFLWFSLCYEFYFLGHFLTFMDPCVFVGEGRGGGGACIQFTL